MWWGHGSPKKTRRRFRYFREFGVSFTVSGSDLVEVETAHKTDFFRRHRAKAEDRGADRHSSGFAGRGIRADGRVDLDCINAGTIQFSEVFKDEVERMGA